MLGQLPKLFDRNFAIGFFLPVVAFAAVCYGLIEAFDLSSLLSVLTTTDVFTNTIIGLLLLWLMAVLLLALNRSLYMLLEGYGRLNPAQLFAGIERRRYRRLLAKKQGLLQDRERLNNDAVKRAEVQAQVDELNMQLAEQFPDSEEWLLPTRFGNVMRAFEVYPRFVYGLDPIEGSNRLLAVVPKDYLQLINDAKAQTDFWLNIWILSLLSTLVYVAFVIDSGLRIVWFPLAALFIAIFALRWIRIAAVEWGSVVKASFDVFVPDLATKLSFPPNLTRQTQKELFLQFSRVIVFRTGKALRDLHSKVDQLSQTAPDGSVRLLELFYTVQDGDTLNGIAQRFGTTAERLAIVNNIRDPELISSGQKLRIWPT